MRRLSLAVVVGLLGLVLGCGGDKKSETPASTVSVTISPTTATVGTSQTQQFTATVTGSDNTAVTWAVNGFTGGAAAIGTISATGLYVAPSAVPGVSVTVSAISQADTTKSASATVTVTLVPALSLTPASVVLPAGAQQQFTVTLSGQSTTATWSVQCQSPTPADCGTIDANGLYTAPLSPPPGGTAQITAAKSDNTARAANAAVTIQFSNATLTGRYAFLLADSRGTFAAAGSLVFDGSGHITSGTEDVNSGGASSAAVTGGSYSVATDGTGVATVQTVGGSTTWNFSVVNHARAFVLQASGTAAQGTLELQDPAQFTLGAVRGGYSVAVFGSNAGATLAMAGAATADGAGALSGGRLDSSSLGISVPLSGSYTAPSSAGRGTLAFTSAAGTQNFAYYVVDAAHIKLVGTDAAPVLAGDLVSQPAGPFSNASFRGNFAFTAHGSASSGPAGQGGVFALDGAGNVSGVRDSNDNGAVQSQSFSGDYNVADAATGRVVMTVTAGATTLQYFLYPRSGGGFSMMQSGAGNAALGAAPRQNPAAFSNAAINGNFAAGLGGINLAAVREVDITGQLVPNGGTAIRGTLAVRDNTVSTATVQLGSYQVDAATGRGTASLQTSSSAFTNVSLGF